MDLPPASPDLDQSPQPVADSDKCLEEKHEQIEQHEQQQQQEQQQEQEQEQEQATLEDPNEVMLAQATPDQEIDETSPSCKSPSPEPSQPAAEHHILDPLITRFQQDLALGKQPGKGRKRKTDAAASSKAKASPKVKAKAAKAKAKAKAEPKEKGRKGKAAKVKESTGDLEGGEAQAAQPRRARAKAAPKAKAAAGRARQASAASIPAPHPVAAAPKHKARKTQKPQTFSHSSIVPYWSRNAVALKVKTGLGVSGLTQAWGSGTNMFKILFYIRFCLGKSI